MLHNPKIDLKHLYGVSTEATFPLDILNITMKMLRQTQLCTCACMRVCSTKNTNDCGQMYHSEMSGVAPVFFCHRKAVSNKRERDQC